MFERFTDQARRVVVLAQEEARLLNHNYIGTEHLLLGLVHEGDGPAADALESLGISLDEVRRLVKEAVGPGKHKPSGHIPFTPRAKKALELSLREALQVGHGYIGPEHILLGLIRQGDGVAAQVLVSLGADLDRVRDQVLSLPAEPGDTAQLAPRVTRRLGLPGRSERALLAGVQARLTDIESRLSVIEERVGTGPDASDLDTEITAVRSGRQSAADAEDYEKAAGLRDRERELLADKKSRQQEWATAHPGLPALARRLTELSDEVARLRSLLSQHGIEPGAEAAHDRSDEAS